MHNFLKSLQFCQSSAMWILRRRAHYRPNSCEWHKQFTNPNPQQTFYINAFGGIPWQRWQFHLQQNAQAYVPSQEMRAEVAADLRMIFNAPDRVTAES